VNDEGGKSRLSSLIVNACYVTSHIRYHVRAAVSCRLGASRPTRVGRRPNPTACRSWRFRSPPSFGSARDGTPRCRTRQRSQATSQCRPILVIAQPAPDKIFYVDGCLRPCQRCGLSAATPWCQHKVGTESEATEFQLGIMKPGDTIQTSQTPGGEGAQTFNYIDCTKTERPSQRAVGSSCSLSQISYSRLVGKLQWAAPNGSCRTLATAALAAIVPAGLDWRHVLGVERGNWKARASALYRRRHGLGEAGGSGDSHLGRGIAESRPTGSDMPASASATAGLNNLGDAGDDETQDQQASLSSEALRSPTKPWVLRKIATSPGAPCRRAAQAVVSNEVRRSGS
jgi:hypothetical protein